MVCVRSHASPATLLLLPLPTHSLSPHLPEHSARRLSSVTNDNIVSNLNSRFKKNEIYTFIGQVLVAANPFQYFPIYDQVLRWGACVERAHMWGTCGWKHKGEREGGREAGGGGGAGGGGRGQDFHTHTEQKF